MIANEVSSIDFLNSNNLQHLAPRYYLMMPGNSNPFKPCLCIDYLDKSIGYANIYCFPKNISGFEARVSEMRNKNKKKIFTNTEMGQQLFKPMLTNKHEYNIYAFFTKKQDLSFQGDKLSNVIAPKYPSDVYVYKLQGNTWNLIKKQNIKKLDDLYWFQYSTVFK